MYLTLRPHLTLSLAFLTLGFAGLAWALGVTPVAEAASHSSRGPAAAATPAAHQFCDFNGDGKTDFAVVRNTGGGQGGQLTWFIHDTDGVAEAAQPWGLSSDFYVPADYDGDNKTDIAVWRGDAPFNSYFYILQSSDGTLRYEQFGQQGDDPKVVRDYDGDGKADPAVYRGGANAGDPSFWYFRPSSGPFAGAIIGNQFGQNGDFPAHGDYNGDGIGDFCVQRNGGGGQAQYFQRFGNGAVVSSGAGDTSVLFGEPTDIIIPGDFDGDGKSDIAVIRGVGGELGWFYEPSSIADLQVIETHWGSSGTDFAAPGDYDGDGKTDIAVWRPDFDPSQNYFFILGSTTGGQAFEWGANGDFPLAAFANH